MKKPRILIQVEGGLVVGVISNMDIEYVVVDHDNTEGNEGFVGSVLEQDSIYENGKFHEAFAKIKGHEIERIFNELSEIKF